MKTTMGPFEHSVKVGNKRYVYTITPINKREVHFECPGAEISQRFLASGIPALLIDLPELIQMAKEFDSEYAQIIRFRLTTEQKNQIQKNAIKNGYNNVSAFIRDLALAA